MTESEPSQLPSVAEEQPLMYRHSNNEKQKESFHSVLAVHVFWGVVMLFGVVMAFVLFGISLSTLSSLHTVKSAVSQLQDTITTSSLDSSAACSPAQALLLKKMSLWEAVERNELATVRDLLIYGGVDPNQRAPSGFTPLHIAAGRGHVQVVQMLLSAGADPNRMDNRMGTVPLHLAAQGGNIEVIDLLLRAGSFIDVQSPLDGNTPLMYSMWYKNPAATRVLLMEGANSNLVAHWGQTAKGFIEEGQSPRDKEIFRQMAGALAENNRTLTYTFASQRLLNAVEKKDVDGVRALLSAGYPSINERRPSASSSVTSGLTPLLMAARDGSSEIVDLLLSHGASITTVDVLMKATAWHKAGYLGRAATIDTIAKHTKQAIDQVGPSNGYTPLHDAVWHHNVAAVKSLLTAGANPDVMAWDGLTPLAEASKYGFDDIVALLAPVSKGVSPSSLGASLFDRVRANDLVAVAKLLSLNGNMINSREPLTGLTALHIAAGLGHAQMVDSLLSAGADVFVLDSIAGTTPLHLAAQGGCVQCAKLLLDHGAFPDMNSGGSGNTPLIDAVWYKNPEVVRLLFKYGVNLNIKSHSGRTAMQMVQGLVGGSAKDTAILQEIVSDLSDYQNSIEELRGRQLLFAAVQSHNLTRVNQLLSNNYLDVNEKSPNIGTVDDGYTPLLLAARNGDVEILVALLKAGADVKTPDYLMKSMPLHKCGYMGRTEICKILVSWPGIELDTQGPINGYSPLHDAIWHGHLDTARVLMKAGANPHLIAWDGLSLKKESDKYGFDEIGRMLSEEDKDRIDVDGKLRIVVHRFLLPSAVSEFLKLAKTYVPDVRKEPGVIKMDFYQSMEYDNLITLVEEWESSEALAMHMAKNNTKQYLAAIESMILSERDDWVSHF